MLRFLTAVLAGAALLFASSAAADAAAFDGETLTYARGSALYRAPLAGILRGQPDWTRVFQAEAGEITDSSCLPPAYERCLVTVVDGGTRRLIEADLTTGAPVTQGFTLEADELKADWYDDTRIMVAAATGPGTASPEGEARLLRLWQRGTPLAEAETILAALPGSRGISLIFDVSTGGIFHAATLEEEDGDTALYHIGWARNFATPALPDQFIFQDFFQGRTVVLLRTSWTVPRGSIPAGALAAYPVAPLLGRRRLTVPETAYVPPPGYGVERALGGRDRLYVHLRGDGGDRLIDVRVGAPEWQERRVAVPGSGEMQLLAVSKLADVALVRRGDEVFAVGRGQPRRIDLP